MCEIWLKFSAPWVVDSIGSLRYRLLDIIILYPVIRRETARHVKKGVKERGPDSESRDTYVYQNGVSFLIIVLFFYYFPRRVKGPHRTGPQ